jgi:hypothetical protein
MAGGDDYHAFCCGKVLFGRRNSNKEKSATTALCYGRLDSKYFIENQSRERRRKYNRQTVQPP